MLGVDCIFLTVSKCVYYMLNECSVTAYYHSLHSYVAAEVIQRVRLAHLRCNPQNISSLVCHCTKCTHTQYTPVCYGWLYIPLFCFLIQDQKLFWKVLKNFTKYRKILPKVLRNILKIFKRKIGKFQELLRRISRNIFLNFEKYSGKF